MKKSPKILIAVVILLLKQTVAFAEPHHDEDRHDHSHDHHEFWQGNIHRFHEQDFDTWKNGRWVRARHSATFGWWWVVNGVWYSYPKAIYPYPDPYIPPTILVQPAAPVVAAPNSPAPEQVWYYCSSPQGYYPYIAECQLPWQKVLASQPPPQ